RQRSSATRRRAYAVRAETVANARRKFDRDHAPNRNAICSSQTIIVARHVHEQRRDVNQAVDSIKDSAMARDGRSHVFRADVALDHTHGEIAELPADTNNHASQDQLPGSEERKGKTQ